MFKETLERAWEILKKPFASHTKLGDLERVKKPGEENGDAEICPEKTKEYEELYLNYPPEEERPEGKKHLSWRDKMMTHVVYALLPAGALFFGSFFVAGLYLGANDPRLTWLLAGCAATIPYWIQIAIWRKRLKKKVWEVFTKKNGKHWHQE